MTVTAPAATAAGGVPQAPPRHRLIRGDALTVLRGMPDASADMAMTSPPYWGQREYSEPGIGHEPTAAEFADSLLEIFAELKRVLKPTGSFWLNLGDGYANKGLMGIPWRVALRMIDDQGWTLRNEVVWNKIKGGLDTAGDRLANTHELLFHFVIRPRDYYYDADAIRSAPRESRIVNGAVVSATGVSGIRYRRQIELSTVLTAAEKTAAFEALDGMLETIRRGELSDFRMIIRGQQRVTHSDRASVSGRAKELAEKGFYFLRYHPKGSKPSDVWDILPEDTQARGSHFAVYPVELCLIPILSTCPPDGVVLDPFCGTGTTMVAAESVGRRSIGIDLSETYLAEARTRLRLP